MRDAFAVRRVAWRPGGVGATPTGGRPPGAALPFTNRVTTVTRRSYRNAVLVIS